MCPQGSLHCTLHPRAVVWQGEADVKWKGHRRLQQSDWNNLGPSKPEPVVPTRKDGMVRLQSLDMLECIEKISSKGWCPIFATTGKLSVVLWWDFTVIQLSGGHLHSCK